MPIIMTDLCHNLWSAFVITYLRLEHHKNIGHDKHLLYAGNLLTNPNV